MAAFGDIGGCHEWRRGGKKLLISRGPRLRKLLNILQITGQPPRHFTPAEKYLIQNVSCYVERLRNPALKEGL